MIPLLVFGVTRMSSKLDVTKNTTKRAEVQYQLKQFGCKIPAFFERSHDEKFQVKSPGGALAHKNMPFIDLESYYKS